MAACRVLFIVLVLSAEAAAQGNRYMVFFANKNNTPYSISQPEAFLSARAIARRNRSIINITNEDLPVTPSYLAQVRATGAKTFFTSRWMNAVLVEATTAQAAAISAIPIVTSVQQVAPGKKLIGGRSKQIRTKESTGSAQATQQQLQMLGLDSMRQDGFSGQGILVSIFDSGFPGVNTSVPFQGAVGEGRIRLTQDFVRNSPNVFQFDKHGTEVFSVVAADQNSLFNGGAVKAEYLLFVTEDVSSEYRIEEFNWLFAAEKADSAGTDVIQSSLGYNLFDDPAMDYKITDLDGKTAVVTRAAAMARDRGIIVVVSAGNEGNNRWRFVTPPADADGILAVGAVSFEFQKAGFSSIGPTADGRIKPDVMALGQSTSVITSNGTLGSASGTSLAAPLVTSLVAGLLQAYPKLRPAEIIQAVKLSASLSAAPNNQMGYGLPHYVAVKNYLESNQSGDDVYVYPNPTGGTLTVAFKKLPESSVALQIFDSLGKVVSAPTVLLNWLNNPLELPVSSLGPGTYFLQVRTGALNKTFRFVKL